MIRITGLCKDYYSETGYRANRWPGGDYNTSGIAKQLLGTCRVMVFDRPAYGYSQRPRWHPWGTMG